MINKMMLPQELRVCEFDKERKLQGRIMETTLQAMPRGRNQYTGVATLQRISNKCIDSWKHLFSVAIFLSAVPENFCSICGAILRISLLLWIVLPFFHLITLKACI